jgi:hypothetical protein
MPVKAKRSGARPRRAAKKGLERPVGLVVRRGALRRFDALTRKTAKLPVVVTWDRREEERRDEQEHGSKPATASTKRAELSVSERRKSERRQKPPFTWELADFVVCELPASTADARAARPRRRTSKA